MKDTTCKKKAYRDLWAFVDYLESQGELVRVDVPVDAELEMTEISTRLLATQGPAVLFTQVKGSPFPVLTNLFGTQRRVGLAIGRDVKDLAELGHLLADLKQPEPPRGLDQLLPFIKKFSRVRHMPVKTVRQAPCQQVVWEEDAIDLTQLPIQTCWPGDAAPLLTWPLVITRGPDGGPVNLGVYRMQLLGPRRMIMRWLRHRGGAQHARQYKDQKIPVAVAIGADPGTILAAVTPVPESLSEYAFAGLLREKRVEVAQALSVDLPVPAHAEIILEGVVNLNDTAPEGPFGDHTGYYNEVELYPVFTVNRVTMRENPLFLTTFTGRPPDEPAILALGLNHLFVPLLMKQFPEITAFHLPMDACSYRVAVVALCKGYPGHAFRVMAGIWSFLRQFLYTKYVIVVDEGVAVEDFGAVMEEVGRHLHPGRDIHIVENTPIDNLDFASPVAGLGAKMGMDATTKGRAESSVVQHVLPDPEHQALNWPAVVLKTMPGILAVHPKGGGGLFVIQIDKDKAGSARRVVESLWRMVPPGAGADHLWIVDDDIDPDAWADLLWALATRTDPGRDVMLEKSQGRFALDATTKGTDETSRRWGEPIGMSEEIIDKVSRRWSEYGLPGSGEPIWK